MIIGHADGCCASYGQFIRYSAVRCVISLAGGARYPYTSRLRNILLKINRKENQ